jgi:hypothetical protein
MRRIIALVTAASLGGCSLFTQGAPSDTPLDRFPRCAEDTLAPTMDASWALLIALSGALVASDGGANDDEARGGLLVTAASAAIFGGAAWHGFNKARECGRVRDAYRARYEQMQRDSAQPQPPPYQLGPPSSAPGPGPGYGPGYGPAPGQLGPPSTVPAPAPAPAPKR